MKMSIISLFAKREITHNSLYLNNIFYYSKYVQYFTKKKSLYIRNWWLSYQWIRFGYIGRLFIWSESITNVLSVLICCRWFVVASRRVQHSIVDNVLWRNLPPGILWRSFEPSLAVHRLVCGGAPEHEIEVDCYLSCGQRKFTKMYCRHWTYTQWSWSTIHECVVGTIDQWSMLIQFVWQTSFSSPFGIDEGAWCCVQWTAYKNNNPNNQN